MTEMQKIGEAMSKAQAASEQPKSDGTQEAEVVDDKKE
jgi:hypothetical protein